MTWDEVVAMGLKLPDVEVAKSYGTAALKVRVGAKSKLLTRLKEDGLSIVLFVDTAEKELLMEVDPAVFFETPHYAGYPALLARLEAADPAQVALMIARTWRHAAPKAAAAWDADREAASR